MFLFVFRSSIENTLLVRGGMLCILSPFSAVTPSGLNLCKSCVLTAVSECICASVLLYLEDTVSFESTITPGFTIFLLPLPHQYLSLKGEGFDKDIPCIYNTVDICDTIAPVCLAVRLLL